MKIGILTLPFHTNYGGIIQAYALQSILKSMGHEVYIINRDIFSLPLQDKILINSKRFLKKIFGFQTDDLFREDRRKREYLLLGENINEFVTAQFENVVTVTRYEDTPPIFDAIVVGSDQIWRPQYLNPIENAYLKFADGWNIKRISYAASFGSEIWSYNENQTKECARLVHKFDALSVREKSGVDLCEKYYGVEAVHVLDPSMLVSKIDYIKLIESSANKASTQTGLFAYVLNLNNTVLTSINRLGEIFDLEPYFASTDRRDAAIEKRKTLKMESWLNCFYQASFVITDSFHACVFSILFNKPFLVLLNHDGNERINSLLDMFGLESRIVTDLKEVTIELQTDINWHNVNEVLENQKKISLDYLKKSLEV